MRITVTSVFVSDQERALGSYRDVLGFARRAPGDEIVCGRAARAAPSALSPTVDDLAAEHARIQASGVRFTRPPTAAGRRRRLCSYTCGNLVHLVEQNA